jgi:NADH dehydrogenase FAD-containing subunit
MKITNHLEEISVYERRSDAFRLLNPHIEVIQDSVTSLDPKSKLISLHSGQLFEFLVIITPQIS